MNFKKLLSIIPLALLCLTANSTSVVADTSERSANGAQRCYENYLQLAEKELLADSIASNDLGKRAEMNFRCMRRYESRLPYTMKAKKSLETIIAELKKKIKSLQKKADKLMTRDVIKAGKIWSQIADLELRLARLKKKQQQGECPPAKTNIRMVFENNTDYEVGVFLHSAYRTVALLGKVASGKILTFTIDLEELRSIVGESAKVVNFSLITTINGGLSKAQATMRLQKLPTRKPCSATARFELFNKNFPVPQTQYYVYGVEAGSGFHFLIGVETSLITRAPCSFAGGGLDCKSHVDYHELAGPYTKYEDAQRAFCSSISNHEYWQFSSCPDRFKWKGGTFYWACEGSVTSAINKYCPAKLTS